MRTVLVDSPGSSPEPHWSSAFLVELATELGPDRDVLSLAAAKQRPRPLDRVLAGFTDSAREVALSAILRPDPAQLVVHAGVGARGSPNLLWIAARMGSPGIAVVRASEVVCQRGDCVDRSGAACHRIDEPEQCAWCCRRSRWRPLSADEFRTRLDLLVAGLLASTRIWLADDDDAGMLEQVGVPRRLLATAPRHALAAAVAAEVRSIRANPV